MIRVVMPVAGIVTGVSAVLALTGRLQPAILGIVTALAIALTVLTHLLDQGEPR